MKVDEVMLNEISHLSKEDQWLVLLAYANYLIKGEEPSEDNVIVFSIFKAKKSEFDSKKLKADVARENGMKGWRPRKDLSVENLSKTKKTQTKPSHNPSKTQEEPKQNQEEELELITNEKPKKPNENQELSVLYNNIYINNNTSNRNNITKDINILIQELKEECNNLWIVYEKKNERNFARHILTANDYWEFADKIHQTRTEFARNIMKASVMIWYWKWPCSWPMSIYQNYSEVYNKTMQQSMKQQKNEIPSF